MFLLKTNRNAAMVYFQSSFKKQIIHFLQTSPEGERGQKYRGIELDSL